MIRRSTAFCTTLGPTPYSWESWPPQHQVACDHLVLRRLVVPHTRLRLVVGVAPGTPRHAVGTPAPRLGPWRA